jgi:hypothetical protein
LYQFTFPPAAYVGFFSPTPSVTWKCHNKAFCIDILNRKKMSFCKNRKHEGKTWSVMGMIPVGAEGCKEKYRRVKMVEILHTHV